jgi:hypothetical protein
MAALEPYFEDGVDEIYICQIGDDQEGFFEFCTDELLPRIRSRFRPYP